MTERCACGAPERCWPDSETCAYMDTGYPWCRPCQEHHRPPECDVDEHGRALASCGCPWDDDLGDAANHRKGCLVRSDADANEGNERSLPDGVNHF